MKRISDLIDDERLARILGIELFEPEGDDAVYGIAYKEALRLGFSEEDAEQRAMDCEQRELDEACFAWRNALYSTADTFFDRFELALAYKHADQGKINVFPSKTWYDSAVKIRQIINGVGVFEFNTTREFLDSGSWTARQCVLTHLHWIKSYAEVYGESSPQTVHARHMR